MDKIFEIEGFRREVASYLVNEEGTILATTYRYVALDPKILKSDEVG